MSKAKAKRPRLSGYCSAVPWPVPEGSYDPHARCTLDGCPCPCHGPAPRPKVLLACLQGRHTTTCGHLSSDTARGYITEHDVAVDAGFAVPVELTLDERRRIIAAHMILDPADALEVVRVIITERTRP